MTQRVRSKEKEEKKKQMALKVGAANPTDEKRKLKMNKNITKKLKKEERMDIQWLD